MHVFTTLRIIKVIFDMPLTPSQVMDLRMNDCIQVYF